MPAKAFFGEAGLRYHEEDRDMAGFILCRTKYSEKPYCLKNMDVNIHSMEELCYFLYNNIYLITSDVIDAGLINYIKNDLEEENLASLLEYLIEQDAGMAEIIITILRDVDFYSDLEIEELRVQIESLDTQNVWERLKARADSFLRNKKYKRAIHNYELILFGKYDSDISDEFRGNVWHNLGIAYAGLMSFKEAADCFKRAWSLNNDEESQRAYISALCLESERNIDTDDELMYVTRKELETIMDHIDEEAEYEPIKHLRMLKSEGRINEYHDEVRRILNGWKQEYRRYIV